MKPKKLVCFDFDGTLIHTPTQDIGKKQWEEKTGLSFPTPGWWGSPESLNLDIFYPPVNEWVFKHYEKHISDKDTYTFLATGRIKKLEHLVLGILDLHNIKFADVHCNDGGETFNFKRNLFEKKIMDNPQAEEFIMFDDRYEHLIKFVEWGKKQKIKVTVIDVLNKKQLL